MESHARQRTQFALMIKCRGCGQVGTVVWEENAGRYLTTGLQRSLIRISSGFHTGDAKLRSGDPQIVCDRCGTPMAD